MSKPVLNVCISGAAGQIGYALIPLFATGLALGEDQPMNLRLLDIPQCMEKLEGVIMEILDGAYPLVRGILPTADAREAFADVDYCVLVGGFPRGPGMVRADLVAKNSPIFKAAGEALNEVGKPTTKVLVVANPANTNCWLCANFAPNIPKTNFCALTRLDQNRAQAQVAQQLDVPVSAVKNVIIWGNHSNRQVPDVVDAKVLTEEGKEEDAAGLLNTKDPEWVSNVFRSTVQKRGKAIIEKRGLSSAMSAANAVKDCVKSWALGTAPGQHVAMAVYSTGNPYGVADDLFYSFPCVCENGEYRIVDGMTVADDVRTLMCGDGDVESSQSQLVGEKQAAMTALGL